MIFQVPLNIFHIMWLIDLDGSLDKLYFDFLWGNLYGYYLLRCFFNTSLFSFLKVFQQNVFLFFWITEPFQFGDCPNFFFNSNKVGITLFSFVVIKLEQSELVTKCEDDLIFSANECFTLSILVDLLL